MTHSCRGWSYQKSSGDACPYETIRSMRTCLFCVSVSMSSAGSSAGIDAKRLGKRFIESQFIQEAMNPASRRLCVRSDGQHDLARDVSAMTEFQRLFDPLQRKHL